MCVCKINARGTHSVKCIKLLNRSSCASSHISYKSLALPQKHKSGPQRKMSIYITVYHTMTSMKLLSIKKMHTRVFKLLCSNVVNLIQTNKLFHIYVQNQLFGVHHLLLMETTQYYCSCIFLLDFWKLLHLCTIFLNLKCIAWSVSSCLFI